jgi:hypothetical protein
MDERNVKWEFEVYDDGDCLWCPRPSSWMAGMGVDAAIRKATGRRTGIMSPDRWAQHQHQVQRLVLYVDGTWEFAQRA